MNKPKIKNSFYWILTLALLSGPAHEVFAQRTRISNDRRKSEKRISHKKVDKKKVVRNNKQKLTKNKQSKMTRKNSSYRNHKNKTYKKGHKRSEKKVTRKIVNKNNDRRDLKKNFRKNKQRKDTGKNALHHIFKNRTYKKGLERSKLKNRSYHKKPYSHKHYRKPSWVNHYKRYHSHHKIGSRFSFLPYGYISFRIGNFRFFAYQGTYYRYDPVYRTYVVIEKPVITSNYTSTKWDRITLIDGSTIEGIYISGNSETIIFEVGDALLEIPASEIQVLAFSQE
ncbi:MAG: hypothetical protein P8Y99_09405 [Calditrichaceae bacterium]